MTDTLSIVIDALSYPWKDGQARENLLYAADGDTLEVRWTLDLQDASWVDDDELPELWCRWSDYDAEAFDTSTPYCWDGCNGISTVHRPGWCRHNAQHADLDCACAEYEATS
jgi:hypothetical protein